MPDPTHDGITSLGSPASGLLETSGQNWVPQTEYQRVIRHKLVYRLREQFDLDPSPYTQEEREKLRKLATRIEECGKAAWLCQSDDGSKAKLAVFRCRSRLCPTCGAKRARRVAARATAACGQMDSRRFLTLTIKSNDAPLHEQFQRLTAAFKALRRSKFWKALCPGGIFTLQCTYNPQRDQYHPHIHAVITGDFIPQARLKEKWLKITGDSNNVDIRPVHSASEIASYIATYISKTNDPTDLPDHRIGDWALQIHGLRLFNTFGSLHNVKIDTREKEDKVTMRRVISMNWLVAEAQSGDQEARYIVSLCTQLKRDNNQVQVPDLLKRVTQWEKDYHERMAAKYRPPPEPAKQHRQPPQGPVLFGRDPPWNPPS